MNIIITNEGNQEALLQKRMAMAMPLGITVEGKFVAAEDSTGTIRLRIAFPDIQTSKIDTHREILRLLFTNGHSIELPAGEKEKLPPAFIEKIRGAGIINVRGNNDSEKVKIEFGSSSIGKYVGSSDWEDALDPDILDEIQAAVKTWVKTNIMQS